jgi:hypothetical protein
MALNNLAALKASAAAWMERAGDPAVSTIIDDCVALCEARINKTPTLRLAEMETEVTLPLIDERATLPPDFLAAKRVVANASSPRLLTYAEPGWYQEAYPRPGGESSFYSIYGTDTTFADIDSVETLPPGVSVQVLHAKSPGTISVLYYARVPPLATTDPNWLLVKSPDVYLYGTILEVLNALEGDGAEKYAGLFGTAIDALVRAQTYSRGGVLTQRASMPAP